MSVENAHAGQSFDEREDFLAVINHRLRNLLLANQRIIELLVGGDFGYLAQSQTNTLQAVLDNQKEVDRLIRMLVDIYEYRNGKKHLEMALCDITAIVQTVINRYAAAAAARHINLTSFNEPKCMVECDENAMTDLLRHIIENAIRHAISSVIVTRQCDNKHVSIKITDNGPGISPSDLSYLFERFFVQSKDGKYAPVTGIGLCLCAQIARAHNGSLTCKSEPGSGTTFVLTLPVS